MLCKAVFLIPIIFLKLSVREFSSTRSYCRRNQGQLHHVRLGHLRGPGQQQQVLLLLHPEHLGRAGRRGRQPEDQLLPGERRCLLWQQDCGGGRGVRLRLQRGRVHRTGTVIKTSKKSNPRSDRRAER